MNYAASSTLLLTIPVLGSEEQLGRRLNSRALAFFPNILFSFRVVVRDNFLAKELAMYLRDNL